MSFELDFSWYKRGKHDIVLERSKCAIRRDGLIIYNDSKKLNTATKICEAFELTPTYFEIKSQYKHFFYRKYQKLEVHIRIDTHPTSINTIILDAKKIQILKERDIDDILEIYSELYKNFYNEFFKSHNLLKIINISNFNKYEKNINKFLNNRNSINIDHKIKSAISFIQNKIYFTYSSNGIVKIKKRYNFTQIEILGLTFVFSYLELSNNLYEMFNLLESIGELDKFLMRSEISKLIES